MKIGRHFHYIISFSPTLGYLSSVMFTHSSVSLIPHPHSTAFSFTIARVLLLYVSPPLCFAPPPTFHFDPTPILTLICHSELGGGGRDGDWGGGSLLWSDSYKLLIGIRNMIAREEGGWIGGKGRDGHFSHE